MATWRRMWILTIVTIGVATVAVIHLRFGVEIVYPMAKNQFSGPFTPAVTALETLVPLILALVEGGTIVWTMAGGVQRERSRIRRGPR
jgi:hypothetical protein